MEILFAAVTKEEATIRKALGTRDMALLLSLLDRAVDALERSESGAENG